ncbi:MAG: pilus assembly protein TadG-related protein [Pseudomonadota bacterium]
MAAIFAAISLVTLLSAVGLAIDVGRLYYANRELQRLADLAAIDGSRMQSQCLGNAGLDEVTAEVAASLRRNRVPEGVTTLTRLGLRRNGDDGLQFFQPAAPASEADSVQVTLSRQSPARILPLFAGEQSRRLTTRAAATADWNTDVSVGPPRGGEAMGRYQSAFFDSALRAGPGSNGGFGAAGGSASVSVSSLVNANAEVNTPRPDLDVPTGTLGLLAQISALLNQTGDTAAANTVDGFAAAVAAGRPGSTVVPAEVLGLPLQGGYDGATTTVGDLLGAIAGAVSEGDSIPLENLCALIPLDELPTAQLLPAFCNTSVTLQIPQPSRSGVFNSTSVSVSNTETSDDVAASAGGVAAVRVGFVNPIDGQPMSLPLMAVAESAQARVTGLSCARMGQAQHVASISANGPRAVFAIGESSRFSQNLSAPGSDPAGSLDGVAPAPLITATVQQLLTATGLGAGLLGNPLLASALSQSVTISVRAGPVVLGDGRGENLCMQGPPFGVPEQCNGAPATVGGTSSEVAAQRIADELSEVEISVAAPGNLPLGLDAALSSATDVISQTLAERLKPAIRLVSGQLVPILQSANLVVGESSVYLNSAQATQPRVYAQ